MKRLRPLSGLPVQEFRKVLGEAKRMAVICHTDMDGLGAARVLRKSSFGDRIVIFATTDTPLRDITPEQEARMLSLDPDLIVFLDIAPSNVGQLERLLRGRKGVVVDHHKCRDLSGVPTIDLRFIASRLFPEYPDRCSTTYLLAELLGESYDPEFVVSALLGDQNFRYYTDHFEATPAELDLGYRVSLLYKQLGSVQSLNSADELRAAALGAELEALALSASSVHELEKTLSSDPEIQRFISEASRDRERLAIEVMQHVRENADAREVLHEFKPASGFLAAGFVYVLQKRIREEFPGRLLLVIVYQKGDGFWRLDGLSTDPNRSVGELFSSAGIGGGHHSVGGGRLDVDGAHPREWFKIAVNQRPA